METIEELKAENKALKNRVDVLVSDNKRLRRFAKIAEVVAGKHKGFWDDILFYLRH